MHCYWLFDEPVNVSTPERVPAARIALGRLAARYAGVVNPSCAQPACVLRLPGTMNTKYEPARAVTIERCIDYRYTLDELMRWCPDEPLRGTGRRGGTGGTVRTGDDEVYRRLREAYCRRGDPADMLGLEDLTISDGEGHDYTTLRVCGLLHDGERDDDELAAILGELWDAYGTREPRAGEIEDIVSNVIMRDPVSLVFGDNNNNNNNNNRLSTNGGLN